jgi:transcriptional regulator with XRE-family HTH domain
LAFEGAMMDRLQCKMARAATGLRFSDIARLAEMSPDTVVRLERGERLKPDTVAAIRAAFESQGVAFLPADEHGTGVRIKARA